MEITIGRQDKKKMLHIPWEKCNKISLCVIQYNFCKRIRSIFDFVVKTWKVLNYNLKLKAEEDDVTYYVSNEILLYIIQYNFRKRISSIFYFYSYERKNKSKVGNYNWKTRQEEDDVTFYSASKV